MVALQAATAGAALLQVQVHVGEITLLPGALQDQALPRVAVQHPLPAAVQEETLKHIKYHQMPIKKKNIKPSIMEKPHTSDNNGTSTKKNNLAPPSQSVNSANPGKDTTNKEKTGKSQSIKAGRGQSLEDLFENNLKDIYSGEKQLVEALPKVAEAAYNEDLQDAFREHLEQTRKHVERLEKIFGRLGIEKGEEEKCLAMEGLIKECNRTIEEFEESPVRDSALIIGAQKIEHYEIAAYGSLCELADVLGISGALNLLERTLDEEETTDKNLTDIAKDINDEAFEMSQRESSSSQY